MALGSPRAVEERGFVRGFAAEFVGDSHAAARVLAGRTMSTTRAAQRREARAKKSAPALLSGGNPQIAKGDGDEPVQRYVAAMPGWKREVGQWFDALVDARVPAVRKAVK